MKKGLAAICYLLITAMLLVGCGGGNSGVVGPGRASTVVTMGSTSMEGVMGVLAEQFREDHPDITVSVEGGGSGMGIEAVSSGMADIGLSSRKLKSREKAMGLTETVLALDGIAVIVNEKNDVADLTVEQIAAIFTGAITSWSEVGGADLKIACIGRESGSGTRSGFESITETEDTCVLAQELTSTGAVVEAVRNNAQAIGYASLSSVEGQERIKAIMVNSVACTEETILDGSYAVQRPFILITRAEEDLSAPAQTFFAFATSAAAGDLVRYGGAVPVAK